MGSPVRSLPRTRQLIGSASAMDKAKRGWKESLSKWSPLEKLESMSSRILLPPTCSTTISTCSTTISTCCNTPNTSSLCTCAANTSSVGNCFPSLRSSKMVDPRTDQNAGRKDEKKKKRTDEEEEEKRGRQIVFSLSINT